MSWVSGMVSVWLKILLSIDACTSGRKDGLGFASPFRLSLVKGCGGLVGWHTHLLSLASVLAHGWFLLCRYQSWAGNIVQVDSQESK